MSDPARPAPTRTCPWCATATVIGLTEEGVVRALTRHLEICSGERGEQP